MADLLDRIAFGSDKTGRPRISGHQFSAYLGLLALQQRDVAWAVSALDLQGDELTQAQLVFNRLNEETTPEGKLLYWQRVTAITHMVNARDPEYVTDDVINKTQVQADLDL